MSVGRYRNKKSEFVAMTQFIYELGSLNMGLALGWCSPALSDLLSVDSKPCDRITLAQSGWVGSLLSLGKI